MKTKDLKQLESKRGLGTAKEAAALADFSPALAERYVEFQMKEPGVRRAFYAQMVCLGIGVGWAIYLSLFCPSGYTDGGIFSVIGTALICVGVSGIATNMELKIDIDKPDKTFGPAKVGAVGAAAMWLIMLWLLWPTPTSIK